MKRTADRSKWTGSPEVGGAGERIFDIAEVRRALPYVQRVLRDAVAAYRRIRRIREQLAEGLPRRTEAALSQHRDEAVAMLNRTIDECSAVGIAYIDIPNARVAFRVLIDGRLASVMWRLGEPISGLAAAAPSRILCGAGSGRDGA